MGTVAKEDPGVGRTFLRESGDGSLDAKLDTRSPEAYLESLLRPALADKRQRRIVLERMGWRSAPPTLEELGQQFGITRERVRQIEAGGLTKLAQYRGVAALKPLHDALVAVLGRQYPGTVGGVDWQPTAIPVWLASAIAGVGDHLLVPAFPDLRLLAGS